MWGKSQGYRWFSLGMAPLSGFEQSPVAPLWNRGRRVPLRARRSGLQLPGPAAFKEKFNPVWEPHYLAYPGGFGLPRVLADVTRSLPAATGMCSAADAGGNLPS